MFFSLFLSVSFSKRPVILIPGMYGSNLHATYHDANLEWFCPKDAEDILVWGNPLRLIKPYYKCTLGLLKEFYNFTSNDLIRFPNISIGPKYFGDLNDIRKEWKIGPFGVSGDFESIIKTLIKKGYKPGYDLLAAPYDWRRAPMYLDDYYKKLQNLIEKAHKQTKKNVTLISYDLGCLVMQRFLLKNVTWKWKQQHVRRAVMVAPEIAGSLKPFFEMSNNKTDRVPLLQNPWIGGGLYTWSSQYAELPNLNVYGYENWIEYPISNVTTYRLANHLVERGFVRGDPVVGLNRSLRILRKELNDYDVPTTVIYNSGIDTIRHVKYPNGIKRMPHYDMSPGDGETLADGAQYICKRWTNIRCIDLKNNGYMFKHRKLMKNPYVVDLIVKAALGAAFSVRGRLNEVAPYVNVIPYTPFYFVRENVRQHTVSTDL